jgi:hypothetical protein
MLKANDAESLIIQEWRMWAPKNPQAGRLGDGGVMEFFEYLQNEKPELLDFRSSGDKRERVRTWIRVQDALKTRTGPQPSE